MDIIVRLFFDNSGMLDTLNLDINIEYLKREHWSRQVLTKVFGISSITPFGVGYGYIGLNSQGETEKDCGPIRGEGWVGTIHVYLVL